MQLSVRLQGFVCETTPWVVSTVCYSCFAFGCVMFWWNFTSVQLSFRSWLLSFDAASSFPLRTSRTVPSLNASRSGVRWVKGVVFLGSAHWLTAGMSFNQTELLRSRCAGFSHFLFSLGYVQLWVGQEVERCRSALMAPSAASARLWWAYAMPQFLCLWRQSGPTSWRPFQHIP